MAADASPEPDLMTSKEVAEYLRLPLPTVYYLAKNGELPSFQVGSRWRFRRHESERIKDPAPESPPLVLVLDDAPVTREMRTTETPTRKSVPEANRGG